MTRKAGMRFFCRHDVEELFLPRGGAHAGDKRAVFVDPVILRFAHGHGLIWTGVPAA